MRYTEARLTEVADGDAGRHRRGRGRFPPHLRRRGIRTRRAARRVSQPAGERRRRHRGRHGDLDPAAQRRRDLRRGDPSDPAPGSHHRRSAAPHARPGFPHRRRAGRGPRRHPVRLRNRPRRLPPAREMGSGTRQARHLADRRHGNPLPGAEGEADRADRPAAGGKEAAAAGRCARRKRREDPPGAGTAHPRRRAGSADGDRVPRHRAGNALPAQHERAGRDAHAAGDVAGGSAARLARSSARGAGPPQQRIGWRRSTGASRCWTAICWSISTSTR